MVVEVPRRYMVCQDHSMVEKIKYILKTFYAKTVSSIIIIRYCIYLFLIHMTQKAPPCGDLQLQTSYILVIHQS